MAYVVGFHAVQAVLERSPERVRSLHVQSGRQDARVSELLALAKEHSLRIESVDKRWLDRHSEGAHQGIVADCHAMQLASEKDLEARWAELGDKPLLLILDGITDPRNLGACLRSAAAANVDAVLFPKRNSAPINEVVLKTAAGGAEALMLVEVTNLARRLEWLKAQGVWLVGTAGEATQDWHEVDLKGAIALVMGSEGKGLRDLTERSCDFLVSIPMSEAVESLNVSVATGVMLFEAVRQRRG